MENVVVPLAEPLTVVLEPGIRLAGRVVDSTGLPLEGAELRVSWPELLKGLDAPARRPGRSRRRSDVEGRFVFHGIRPGPVTLEAHASGCRTSRPLTFDLRGAEEHDDLVIELERGATLTGRVKTVSGRPLDAVRVTAGRPVTFTDAEGRYRLDGVDPGVVSVEAYHSGYGALQRDVEVDLHDDNTLDLTFADGHAVRGRAVDDSRRPLSGVALELLGRHRRGAPAYRARTDADGLFQLMRVAEGEYRIEVSKRGWVLVGPSTLHVATEDVEELILVLEHGASLTGRVVGLEPEALTRVRVEARDARGGKVRGRVDHTGAYEVRGLAPGPCVVRAELAGGRREARERVELPPGGARVHCDLRFVERFAVTGAVLLEGEPLAGATVSLAGDLAVERKVRTNHLGRFRVEDLEPATYRLGIAHSRELVVHDKYLELDGDREVTIELFPARASGWVLSSENRQPLSGAVVKMVRLSENGEETNALAVTSDEDGAFDFPRVPPGRFRLSVLLAGYETVTWGLELEPGAVRRDLELEVQLEVQLVAAPDTP